MKVKNLLQIQSELKAPKGQYNSFGKYKYRSCEDILEAAKPICAKYGVVLTLSDELVNIGERYYIKATARLADDEGGSAEVTAYAREEETKKGMDGSQITGTASSYARKYALNGLFLIDDTRDADTDEYKTQSDKRQSASKQAEPKEEPKELTNREKVIIIAKERGISLNELAKDYSLSGSTTEEEYAKVLKDLEG